MNAPVLPVSGDPGQVWRVGFEPDVWAWAPWQYATDEGRFNGRWDDQAATFRTLYTADSLLGCFLELLAPQRPNDVAFDEIFAIDDDADESHLYSDPERGALDLSWLNGRLFGSAVQTGRYAEVTMAEALGFLDGAGVFARLGIPPRAVDAALLKEAAKRDITRTVARFLFDLRAPHSATPLVNGVAFRSRMGDDIRMWAVFERGEEPVSEFISPAGGHQPVTAEQADLVLALRLLGLHWV